ncbi:hypothetical protein B0H63DRAFT_213937 [Podospora didyma]|uniref:Ig-like domain-containing protein n=1 Tax=Podospora didyma TaxID=330526 RepID=A0AAE0NHW8_9PEZI|nr:hypothetical protein B0H63DRAFT_213937 [Podospora didyma]
MSARLLFLAVSAAASVSAQLAAAQGCTSSSFAIPSWWIQGLQSSSAGVSFQLVNRATNYTADAACQITTTGGWNACSTKSKENGVVSASVQVTETSAQVFVNQTWTCSDRTGIPPVTFAAVGNNSVALTCTGSVCEAELSSLLVKGSLLAPVAITPAYLEGPPGHASPGCLAAAQNPWWTLSNTYYVKEIGDGLTSASSQSFYLLLTNPATGYQASCMSGSGYDDTSFESQRLVCAGGEFGLQGAERYTITTDASFDPATFKLSLNQTWYCDDVDAGKPFAITGTASEILALDCKDYGTDTVSTTCNAPGDITVNGQLLSKSPLPAYSLAEPLPVDDGCTISSVLNPQWAFSQFHVDNSLVTFEIILKAPRRGYAYPISISQDATAKSSDGWYPCVLGPGASDTGGIYHALWPSKCSIKYTPATKELIFKADWVCGELDPDHPITFSGVTTTTVNTSLACETADGISQCFTADLGYTWSAGISNVTWH